MSTQVLLISLKKEKQTFAITLVVQSIHPSIGNANNNLSIACSELLENLGFKNKIPTRVFYFGLKCPVQEWLPAVKLLIPPRLAPDSLQRQCLL
jgi:hypothetical protein